MTSTTTANPMHLDRPQTSSASAWRSDGGFCFYAILTGIFAVAVGGTVYLCRSMSGGMPMPGGWAMSMMWMRMPGQTWLTAAAMFMLMWFAMMVAMMLPCLAPMLLSYRRSLRRMGATQLEMATAAVGLGYVFLWTLVGAIIFPLGVGLVIAEMRWDGLARCVPTAVGTVFVLVGMHQFTKWKSRQLNRCRRESGCVSQSRMDATGAWRHGIAMGVNCATCCFGLMMLLLVGGAMDLGLMAAVTIAITIERLARRPERAARIVGGLVMVAGMATMMRAMAMR